MKLRLNKEVLTELTAAELTHVVGGSEHCMTVPVDLCLSVERCETSQHPRCQVPTLEQSCAC